MIVIAVIALYLVAYFGFSFIGPGLLPKAGGSLSSGDASPELKPLFESYFINEHKGGTISHVSSIAPAGKNRMIATWYSGSREGAKDVAIYYSFFDLTAKEWSSPSVLVDREQASSELGRYIKKLGNPLVISGPRGRLWLFYASVTLGGWSGTSLNYKVSDDGRTWSKSKKMILSPFFNLASNVKNGHISLYNGSFILPVYHEFINKYSQSLIISTVDEEPHFKVAKMTRSMKAIQPSLLKGGGGKLFAYFRNMAEGPERSILSSVSDPDGIIWSDISATALPNPNSGFCMTVLDDGTFMGVINYSYENRSNLAIVISEDEGVHWRKIAYLENSAGNEYSYPFIERDSNGLYHVTYTYERKRIKHIVFNDKWLSEKIGGDN